MHIVEPGIWQENWKTRKMRNTNSRICICSETWKKVENEKQTLFDLEYGEKTEKRGKWDANTVDLEYGEKSDQRLNLETHMVGPGTWQATVKNVKNEICTL